MDMFLLRSLSQKVTQGDEGGGNVLLFLLVSINIAAAFMSQRLLCSFSVTLTISDRIYLSFSLSLSLLYSFFPPILLFSPFSFFFVDLRPLRSCPCASGTTVVKASHGA